VKQESNAILKFQLCDNSISEVHDTLQNIVKGLNKAGFSDKDYKLADELQLEEAKKAEHFTQLTITPTEETAANKKILQKILTRQKL